MARDTTGWTWSIFFARWVLGLTFLMAGWWKVFQMGPTEHARRFFVEGYGDSWIPAFALWAVGWIIPWLELAAGLLLCLGLRRREALLVLGGILVVVTYGHLLSEPLFSLRDHIFPRLVLLLFVLSAPVEEDRLSVDSWLARRAG